MESCQTQFRRDGGDAGCNGGLDEFAATQPVHNYFHSLHSNSIDLRFASEIGAGRRRVHEKPDGYAERGYETTEIQS